MKKLISIGTMLIGTMLIRLLFAQTTSPTIVPLSKEPSHRMVLDNEYVRVFYVEVPPHGETQYHQYDMNYIFVTLGDASVDIVRVGEKPEHLDLNDGDIRFSNEPFVNKIVNVGDKPFRNYTIEIKHKTKLKHIWGIEGFMMSCDKFGEDGEKSCEGHVVTSDDLDCSTLIGGPKTHFTFDNDRPFLLLPDKNELLAGVAHFPSEKETDTLIANVGKVLWIKPNDIHRNVHNSIYGKFAVCTFNKL
jgi:hypothetical protein